MTSIVLIAHNIRSCHNVGSLLRTADGMGADNVYLTGYTPYPHNTDDKRLPHLANKIHNQIAKTALGAEQMVAITYSPDVTQIINKLKKDGYTIVALEQTNKSLPLPGYKPAKRIALIVGREVEGIEPEVINQADKTVFIPMYGQKESFNVVQAAAMALYHLRFTGQKYQKP